MACRTHIHNYGVRSQVPRLALIAEILCSSGGGQCHLMIGGVYPQLVGMDRAGQEDLERQVGNGKGGE